MALLFNKGIGMITDKEKSKEKLKEKVSQIVDMIKNSPLFNSIPNIFNPFKDGNITENKLMDFLSDRVFDKARPDKAELLALLGLTEYNPLEIAKKTHGIIMGDECWLRFDLEPFNWENAHEILYKKSKSQCIERD